MVSSGREIISSFSVIQQRKWSRGLQSFVDCFLLSARMDDVFTPVAESTEGIDLVPKEPYEPALELTEAGIVRKPSYVRRAGGEKSATGAKSTTSRETGIQGLQRLLEPPNVTF